MADVIQLLPDAVANQIAAGEVVQRPASVVKEMVENAIDAGSSSITVVIKDAGRTLIQIIDNGCGMSETDARLSFERHATSKIRCADDLFALTTMGFRGEALASIAAIASVELRTRKNSDELGTLIVMSGSVIEKQESVSCPEGTNFSVKNLFFNVPARRKFLKSDNVEFAHIVDELHRVALANPQIAFTLIHNDKEVIAVPASPLRQRIINLFGKQMDKVLLPVDASTNLVTITGYVGNPSYAKKRSSEQFFFVNNRFFRQKSFAWALMQAYQNLIAQGNYPAYFIYFDINPADIDVNIHPTKTEIKFTHEYETSQLLEASVKQVLGKFNIVPSLDFSDDTNYSDLFAAPKSPETWTPTVEVKSGYNPFRSAPSTPQQQRDDDNLAHWQSLYSQLHKSTPEPQPVQQQLPMPDIEIVTPTSTVMQIKGRWIVTALKSGLVVIDQQRAHERILYEKFLNSLRSGQRPSQAILMPQHFNVSASDFALLRDVLDDVRCMGFDIEEFGNNTFVVNGVPADCKTSEIDNLLGALLENYREHQQRASAQVRENLAQSMAESMAITYGQSLSATEMQRIVSDLFQCSSPNITPDGRKILFTLSPDDIVGKLS